jgi:hypothetical protein
MLHNQQGYMMYPMMDQNQAYQWNQYNYDQSQQNISVDSARGKSTHGHSKSSSHDKDGPKKMSPKVIKRNTLANNNNQAANQNQQAAQLNQGAYPQNALNQFVPVYMLPPGFAGHPGAFNAALAAHAAQQQQGNHGNNSPNNANIQQAQAQAAAAAAAYQMPTYGHYPYGIQVPYGFQMPAQNKGAYYNPSGYSGSDYNSASHSAHSHTDSSHRGSKSTDSMSKRNSRSLTSKDSATHSTGASNKGRKNSGHPKNMKKNTKKFQSTHQINIQKGTKVNQHQAVKLQNSCGRSHSVGSDLSAGCSASACQPNNVGQNNVQLRSCSHDSHPDSGRQTSNNSNEKRKISGCCSSECDHHGPIFQNMRKFSNNQDFKKPDGDLTKKLIELIEFYLSDEYLAKDKYLLRQIRCKSEGYISIKLMTSFKKVKKLTRDWRSVRFALLQSPNLIVSPEGFRVKRATQLPENLRKPRLLSSVVTIRLTEELSAVDALTSKFSKFGEIGLVRILKPGKEIPSDLRNYATQVPDIGKSMCAVVDFEQSESALQAVRCLKDELMTDKMRLALLGPRVRRTLYKQDRADDENDDDIDDAEINKSIEEALKVNPTGTTKEPLEQQDTIRPETHTYKNVASSNNNSNNNKIKRVESNDSNTTNCTSTTNKSLDLSVDSGNCAASGGTASNDEDLKAIHLDDGSSKNAMKKDSKLNSIIRQPEGPGSNPVLSGFAYKRSALY